MIFSRLVNTKNEKKRSGKTENRIYNMPLSSDEMHQIDIEMNWGYGMLPPGCFSYSIWYFH